MIPDKIYIPLYPNLDTDGFHLGDDWMEKPDSYSKCEHVEYIRKEALLEWARELNETYHKEYEISKYTCGEHWGQMVAFQKVIDKLNSM